MVKVWVEQQVNSGGSVHRGIARSPAYTNQGGGYGGVEGIGTWRVV